MKFFYVLDWIDSDHKIKFTKIIPGSDGTILLSIALSDFFAVVLDSPLQFMATLV